MEYFDNVMKVDVTGATPSLFWHAVDCYCGEPIFVPAPSASAEDDGVIMSLVLNTTSTESAQPYSFLLILNATNFDQLANVPLPYSVPLGFHGRFYPPPSSL